MPPPCPTPTDPRYTIRTGKRAAFIRNRDIFVRDLSSGRLTQIRERRRQRAACTSLSMDEPLSFRVDNAWFVRDFGQRLTAPAAIVKAEKDPNAAATDDLREMQLRTFSTLKKLHDDLETTRKHDEALQKAT